MRAVATRVRRLILTVHLSIGLAAGAFTLLLAITGSIMAFEPELDRLLHPHLSYVKPGGNALSLVEIGEAVSRQFRGEPVVAYLPSESPDLSSEVILPSGVVCVNQYTGEILGTRTRGQTVFGLAHDLHVQLAAGDVGRNVMKWSGVAMLVSSASGLYLWWPRKRIGIRGWKSAAFWFDLHNSVGILALAPLLLLATTGTVIAFGDQAGTLLGRTGRRTSMSAQHRSAPGQTAPGAAVLTPDEAVVIALTQMPGAVPYRVQMPQYGGAYRVSLDYRRDKVAGERNLVVIDQYSGEVMSLTRSGDLSSAERALAANEAIHTGAVLGMPGRIVAWIASIIVPVQVMSGVFLWLRRRGGAAS
jgi:uncharacterized iron-regulated membrane protein